MKGKPGSSIWLLQHELRMFWFNSTKRRGLGAWISLIALAWLGLHVLAYFLLRSAPAVPADALPIVAMGITALMVVLGTFMFSSGLKAGVDSLFERGDVDLLLSSPLPSRSIFTVRLAAITFGVASVYLALVAPLVNAGVLNGHITWLAVYPAILAWASICCSLAMLLTLFLVRTLGARKTRVIAQVLSAIAGAFLFLLTQAQNMLHPGVPLVSADLAAQVGTAGSLLAPDSPLWSPGRAALGAGIPLAILVTLAVALFFFTIQLTHGFFVHGLQQAVSTVRAKPRGTALEGKFDRHLLEVVLRKEWRLIMRDPQLLSQVLLQLLYLLPLGFVVVRADGAVGPGIAAALVMLAASLTTALTWIIVAAEDAPDLLQTSPAAARIIRSAKLAAATMPPLALTAVPLLWSVLHHATSGLMMCFTVVAATFCAALIGMWHGRAAPRKSFTARAKGNTVGTIFELLGTMAWAGTAFLLTGATGAGQSAYDARWAGITLAIASLILLLAWVTRRRAG